MARNEYVGSALGRFLSTATAPVGAAVGAVFAIVTLLAAARTGQVASIAGYAFGLSAVAIVLTAVGGGTTLAFTVGKVETRHAVRSFRLHVVLPVGILTAIAITTYAGITGTLILWTVLCGGLAGAAANLSEIEAAELRSTFRTPLLTTFDILSRGSAFLMVLAGVDFALAMALSAGGRYAALAFAARHDPSRLAAAGPKAPTRDLLKRSFSLSLFGIAMSYVLIDRLPFLTAPAVVGDVESGRFATLLTAQQTASAVLVTGLQVALSLRARHDLSSRWLRYFELTTMAVAVAVACSLVIATEAILEAANLPQELAPAWTVLALGLPAAVLTRLTGFRLLADGRRNVAGLCLSVSAAVALIAYSTSPLWCESPAQLAILYPVTEGISALALLGAAIVIKRRGN